MLSQALSESRRDGPELRANPQRLQSRQEGQGATAMDTELTGIDRRSLLAGLGAVGASSLIGASSAHGETVGPRQGDRVFLTNEDSNTLTAIDPVTDTVIGTVNLTSFDEDPRPPFRFQNGGVIPTHGDMIQKPLYHGAISVHGCAPSPDSSVFATCGRGSGNLYMIDPVTFKVFGNTPNPQRGPTTNEELLTSGIMLGREPHEPTYTRTGREIWVALRGEARIAVVDSAEAMRESSGEIERGASILRFMPSLPGAAMVWFSASGSTAFVLSQKTSQIELLSVSYDANGYSTANRKSLIDCSPQDPFGFSPFLKLSPDGAEMWISHKLADGVSVYAAEDRHTLLDHIALGERARPNHIEFVRNARADVAYITQARIDDDGPDGNPSSRIAIVDRSAPSGQRRIVGHFFSYGREAHGIWTDPSNTKLYVAHELDQLPGMPEEGQGVCSVFDVADPMSPRFVKRIAIGQLKLPSGQLRNKKSVNCVYVRPGARSATAM